MHSREHQLKASATTVTHERDSKVEGEMQIVLQRKLGIKAVNLIVHMKKETESGAAHTARLVVNHPNPRTQCEGNAFPNPKEFA